MAPSKASMPRPRIPVNMRARPVSLLKATGELSAMPKGSAASGAKLYQYCRDGERSSGTDFVRKPSCDTDTTQSAELRVIDGVGHVPYLTHPQVIVDQLDAFARRISHSR